MVPFLLAIGGSAMASGSVSTTAPLSLATMSFGVPFGTQIADHSSTWKPGSPASSTVGIFGAAARRLVSVMA